MTRFIELAAAVVAYGCVAMLLGGLIYWTAYWIWCWVDALRNLEDPLDVEGWLQ